MKFFKLFFLIFMSLALMAEGNSFIDFLRSAFGLPPLETTSTTPQVTTTISTTGSRISALLSRLGITRSSTTPSSTSTTTTRPLSSKEILELILIRLGLRIQTTSSTQTPSVDCEYILDALYTVQQLILANDFGYIKITDDFNRIVLPSKSLAETGLAGATTDEERQAWTRYLAFLTEERSYIDILIGVSRDASPILQNHKNDLQVRNETYCKDYNSNSPRQFLMDDLPEYATLRSYLFEFVARIPQSVLNFVGLSAEFYGNNLSPFTSSDVKDGYNRVIASMESFSDSFSQWFSIVAEGLKSFKVFGY